RHGHVPLLVVHDLAALAVDGEDDLRDVRAVALALDDGPQGRAVGPGDRAVPGVDLVRVAVEDRVHVRTGVVDDAREDLARRDLLLERRAGAGRRPLVEG